MKHRFWLGVLVGLTGLMAAFTGGWAWTNREKWSGPRQTYLCYFEDSVVGLRPGSEVFCKGIRLGEVSALALRYRPETHQTEVRAELTLHPDRFPVAPGQTGSLLDPAHLADAIQGGLQARLNLASLFSGKLAVELDLNPGTRPLAPRAVREAGAGWPEIPTQPAHLQELVDGGVHLMAQLDHVDVADLAQATTEVLQKTRAILAGVDLRQLTSTLQEGMATLATIVGSDEFKTGVGNVRESLGHLNVMMARMDKEAAQGKGVDVAATLQEAHQTLLLVQKLTAEMNALLQPNSPLRYQLDTSLYQLTATASSLQELLDFVQRNPTSLLFGHRRRNP